MNKKNKILIIGSSHPSSLETMYYKAFKHLEFENVILKDFNITSNLSLKRVLIFLSLDKNLYRKNIINFFKNCQNYFDLVIVFKGMELDKETLFKLKTISPSSKWINIYTDDPFNINSKSSSNKNILDCISFYDFYCIWSKNIKRKIDKIIGSKAIYLPFAFDSLVKFKNNFYLDQVNILFYGTYDLTRAEMLKHITNYSVDIYGNNWKNNKLKNKKNFNIYYKDIYQDELSAAIFRSKLVLNNTREQVGDAHNMRTFEIPGYKGLMLTTRTHEQNYFFPENEACLMYSHKDEMLEKIDRALSSDQKIKKIRGEGIKIAKEHTYIKRAQFLNNIL
jgi:spore maturation protein CgeB